MMFYMVLAKGMHLGFQWLPCHHFSETLPLRCPYSFSPFPPPSYPLLKLPLPGTGPVEFSTPVKGYSPPPADSDHKQGEPSEQPEWVGAQLVTEESQSRELIGGG